MQSLVEKHQLQNCACFNIRKSARVITQLFDETLQPAGLRATQFSILAVTSHIKTITVSELAKILLMDRTTITRNLRPLEKRGLIKTAQGEDKRTRLISLSKEGLDKLKQAIPLWKQAQKKVKNYLGNERFEHLLSELNFLEKIL